MLRYVSPVAEQTADVYWSGEALWICFVGAAIVASTFFQLLGVTIAAFLKYFFSMAASFLHSPLWTKPTLNRQADGCSITTIGM